MNVEPTTDRIVENKEATYPQEHEIESQQHCLPEALLVIKFLTKSFYLMDSISRFLRIDSISLSSIGSGSLLAMDSMSLFAIDSISLAIDSMSLLAIDSMSLLAMDSMSLLAIDSISLAIDSMSLAMDSMSLLAMDSMSRWTRATEKSTLEIHVSSCESWETNLLRAAVPQPRRVKADMSRVC